MPATISLCIIAKNEAAHIGRCIKSAKDFVDQIVVVDTGSTDNTVELARSLGAQVFEIPWENDFSAARNASLEKATGDWILFMDCDEELDTCTCQELPFILNNPDYDAYYVNIVNFLGSNRTMKFHSIRIFRNKPCFRFKGKVHEQIVYSILENSDYKRIGKSQVTLIHHGYNPENTNIQAKIKRNMKLLKEEPPENHDGFYFYNLGTEFFRQGRLNEALANYIESLKRTSPRAGYGPILAKKTVLCLVISGRYRDALEQVNHFKQIYPGYGDLYLLEAASHYNCGRYSKAKDCLEQHINLAPPKRVYPLENKIFGMTSKEFIKTLEPLVRKKKTHAKLSVGIIAEDKGNNLKGCIHSAGELASEIIIIDAGLADSAKYMASQMGAQVYKAEPRADFSNIYNLLFEHAKGNWILLLKACEQLVPEESLKISALIDNPDIEGYILKLHKYTGPAITKNNFFVEGACRLFRNRPDYRFQNAFDDEMGPVIEQLAGKNKLATADITINNYKNIYASLHVQDKRTGKKIREIAKYLLANKKGCRDNCRARYTLAGELFNKRFYKAALVHYKQILNNTNDSFRKVPEPVCFFNIKIKANSFIKAAECLIMLNKFKEAIQLLDTAQQLFPDYTDVFYLKGFCFIKTGQLDKAANFFNKCLIKRDAPWHKYICSPGTGSYRSLCALAAVYAQQGKLEKSLKTYVKAAQIPEGIDISIEQLTFLLFKNGKAASIIKFMQENNLTSWQHFSAAAKTLIKLGRTKESMELIDAAHEKLRASPCPDGFEMLNNLMYNLLGLTYSKAAQNFPQNKMLEKLKKFFPVKTVAGDKTGTQTLDDKANKKLLYNKTNMQESINLKEPVSIIVVTMNGLEFTRLCVKSILEYSPPDIELIFVDNSSTDGTLEYLYSLNKKLSNIKLISLDKNYGFAGAVNRGLAAARGKYIILLNNDTVVTENWLNGLLYHLQDKEVGIVGPVSNNVGSCQRLNIDFQNIDQMHMWSHLHRRENYLQCREPDFLSGFCMAIKREVVEEIGGFDERFFPGNFEDDDYCLRAKLAGFKLRIADDVFIYHAGSKTFKQKPGLFKKAFQDNWQRYKEKWKLPDNFSIKEKNSFFKLLKSKPAEQDIYYPLPKINQKD